YFAGHEAFTVDTEIDSTDQTDSRELPDLCREEVRCGEDGIGAAQSELDLPPTGGVNEGTVVEVWKARDVVSADDYGALDAEHPRGKHDVGTVVGFGKPNVDE